MVCKVRARHRFLEFPRYGETEFMYFGKMFEWLYIQSKMSILRLCLTGCGILIFCKLFFNADLKNEIFLAL